MRKSTDARQLPMLIAPAEICQADHSQSLVTELMTLDAAELPPRLVKVRGRTDVSGGCGLSAGLGHSTAPYVLCTDEHDSMVIRTTFMQARHQNVTNKSQSPRIKTLQASKTRPQDNWGPQPRYLEMRKKGRTVFNRIMWVKMLLFFDDRRNTVGRVPSPEIYVPTRCCFRAIYTCHLSDEMSTLGLIPFQRSNAMKNIFIPDAIHPLRYSSAVDKVS